MCVTLRNAHCCAMCVRLPNAHCRTTCVSDRAMLTVAPHVYQIAQCSLLHHMCIRLRNAHCRTTCVTLRNVHTRSAVTVVRLASFLSCQVPSTYYDTMSAATILHRIYPIPSELGSQSVQGPGSTGVGDRLGSP